MTDSSGTEKRTIGYSPNASYRRAGGRASSLQRTLVSEVAAARARERPAGRRLLLAFAPVLDRDEGRTITRRYRPQATRERVVQAVDMVAVLDHVVAVKVLAS